MLFAEPFTITDATESSFDAACAVKPFSRFFVAMFTFLIVFSLTSSNVTFAITVFVDMSLTPLGSDKFTVYSVSFVIPLTFIFTGIYDIFSSVASSL